MKVQAVTYEHEPRISLFLVPETDVERVLLQSLWKHGTLVTCNGVCDGSSTGYAITTRVATTEQSVQCELASAKREIERFTRETALLRGNEAGLTRSIATLTKERDEAREAARWIFENRPCRNTPVMAKVYERWPWLAE